MDIEAPSSRQRWRHPSRRPCAPVAVGLAIGGFLTAGSAVAAPSAPLPAVIAPADGSEIVAPVGDGVTLRFSCPPFHDSRGTLVGAAGYAVGVSRTPADLSPGGQTPVIETSPGQCEFVARYLGPPERRIGGTYYWRVVRSIATNTYEAGPITSFVLRVRGRLDLRLRETLFSGYLTLGRVDVTGLPKDVPIRVQRRLGARWVSVSQGPAPFTVPEKGTLYVSLPAGRQRVRAVADGTVVSPIRTVNVILPRIWSTRDSAGSYQSRFRDPRTTVVSPVSPVVFRSLTFVIAPGGRRMTSFAISADVPCDHGVTSRVSRRVTERSEGLSIAPDGRFLKVDPGTGLIFMGRIVGNRVTGFARVATGDCAGSVTFVARRRGG